MKLLSTYLILMLFCTPEPLLLNEEIEKRTEIDWLIGHWEGAGQLFGNEASFAMNWKNSLNDKFLELDFQNEFVTTQGSTRTMKAKALYKHKSDSVTGYWFDTRGTMLPLRGTIQENTLVIYWGDKSTEQGKTSYLKVDTHIETIDYYLKEGEYYQFGNATYKKRI